MTFFDLPDVLAKTGVPFALHHWESPPRPPYGVYLPLGTENFAADDTVYAVVEQAAVELYSTAIDRELTQRVERALDEARLFWERDVEYVEPLRLYKITYEIEV